MARVDFITQVHTSTKRDYLGRVNESDKAEMAVLAGKWGKEYWDGDRKTGYGGYKYDGRWAPVARAMEAHYKPKSVLDVGCGKGFLLYEFQQLGCAVKGLDISTYALENAKPEVKGSLIHGSAAKLPFADNSFDLVYSINTLHNLPNYDLFSALKEIQRVGVKAHVTVESFRNEREKVNLLYWQLTCRSFYAPEEWEWMFQQAGYTGDHSFIFFE